MARVTVEDCVDKVSNRFDLVLFAAQRARQISGGADLTIDRDRDKNPVVALREIAEETIRPRDLEEGIVTNLQKVRVDEEDETEELASLSDAAEALRLTAAAPPRPTPSGGDYEQSFRGRFHGGRGDRLALAVDPRHLAELELTAVMRLHADLAHRLAVPPVRKNDVHLSVAPFFSPLAHRQEHRQQVFTLRC